MLDKLKDLNYRLLSFFIMASYKLIINFEKSLSFIQPKMLVQANLQPNVTNKRAVPGFGNAFMVTLLVLVTIQNKKAKELKKAKMS